MICNMHCLTAAQIIFYTYFTRKRIKFTKSGIIIVISDLHCKKNGDLKLLYSSVGDLDFATERKEAFEPKTKMPAKGTMRMDVATVEGLLQN